MPSASRFFPSSRFGELGEIGACVPTQAVLAILHGKDFRLFQHCRKKLEIFKAMSPERGYYFIYN